MSIPALASLGAIRSKVRTITARPSSAQISDEDIDRYINTWYLFDMPAHLKLQNLRVNYQFLTSANIPVYDFPRNLYLTSMPPVYIGGYQSYMTQSRDNFFRINPNLNFLQQAVYTGDGTPGPYTGQFLSSTPILRGFKPNPPGAYSSTGVTPRFLNWNVLVSGIDANGNSQSLVDDGGGAATVTQVGNLVSVDDASDTPTVRGTINYITGAIDINGTGFPVAIESGNSINVQYIPYVASRPQSVAFYQDQFLVYPIPDQAYTVSFEAFKYPTAFLEDGDAGQAPQLQEWWQLLAYGAADKIFADNGDLENMQKFRPLLKEQMDLVQRRTIVQYTPERVSTIYAEQSSPFYQFPFGNNFSGF